MPVDFEFKRIFLYIYKKKWNLLWISKETAGLPERKKGETKCSQKKEKKTEAAVEGCRLPYVADDLRASLNMGERRS